jgi:hypothetical protein
MRVWIALVVALGLLSVAGDGCAADRTFCYDGNFMEGMHGWTWYSSEEVVTRVVPAADAPSTTVLEVRVPSDGKGLVRSQPFPVRPHIRCEFRAQVQRVRGGGSCDFHLEWLDANREHIAYEYANVATLVGRDWVPWRIEAIAPGTARYGRIEFGLPAGAACRICAVCVTELPPSGQGSPRLEVDMLSEPLPRDSETTHELRLRIENRGDVELRDLAGSVEVPRGVNCSGATTFTVPMLGFSESTSLSLVLRGYPANIDDPVTCTVRAVTTSGPVEFAETSRFFVTTPVEKITSTSALNTPRRPALPVKLGCYYFPVMLDWDRNNWGVRKVDYLKPRLGYYDEALPQVADWHITWAAQHGISFFVFDWYFNQGFDYLNDALEKGFLGSRFTDSMEFCIDWCNEGHCGQFKKVVFDLHALEEFITVLCERYFIRKNYLRVDGKPVVIIHVPLALVNDLGDWEQCRKALDRLRDIARRRGHPGVYFVAVQSNNPFLPDYRSAGFDAVTAYAFGNRDLPINWATRSLPYDNLIPRHRECFEIACREAARIGVDYIPSAWVGWDDNARSAKSAWCTEGNTPGAFRRMLEFLPDHACNPARLALFESWNEWGEGGQAEPGRSAGFGRLAAIRDALSQERGPYEVAVPPDAEVRHFETTITCEQVDDMYQRRYAHKLGLHTGFRMDFDSVHELTFQPSNGIAVLEHERGCLVGTTKNDDPALIGPPCMGIPADTVRAVEVRMKVAMLYGSGAAETTAELFWQRKGDPGFAQERSVLRAVPADGKFHTCRFDVSDQPEWTGLIDRLRLDPIPGAGGFEIDWIRTVPTANR